MRRSCLGIFTPKTIASDRKRFQEEEEGVGEGDGGADSALCSPPTTHLILAGRGSLRIGRTSQTVTVQIMRCKGNMSWVPEVQIMRCKGTMRWGSRANLEEKPNCKKNLSCLGEGEPREGGCPKVLIIHKNNHKNTLLLGHSSSRETDNRIALS